MMPTHDDRERFAQSHRQDAAHARQSTSGGWSPLPRPKRRVLPPFLMKTRYRGRPVIALVV